MRVTLAPFDGVSNQDLRLLQQGFADCGLGTQLASHSPIPSSAYNSSRQQFKADKLLYRVQSVPGEKVIGIINQDMYRYVLNCVLGLADLPGRCAIISLHRLKQDADQALLAQRMTKLALHELGHTCGLEHCSADSCVMRFSANVAIMDTTSNTFCHRCQIRFLPQNIAATEYA